MTRVTRRDKQDSLLRPAYGHHKQGASFGHAETASRALRRRGLSPQVTTISTAQAAPVIAEARYAAAGPPPGVQPPPRVKQAPTRPVESRRAPS